MRAEELLYKFNSQNPHATMLSEDQDNYKRKELQTKKYYVLLLSVDCIFIVRIKIWFFNKKLLDLTKILLIFVLFKFNLTNM